MMDENSIERFRKILGPFEERIARVIYTAWDRSCKEWRGRFLSPSKRGFRNDVYECIRDEVYKEFPESDSYQVFEEHESISISFNAELVIRFKKMDSLFRTSNNQTGRSVNLDAQLPLFGYPDCARVIAGYVPRDLESEIDVYVVMSNGNNTIWNYKLERESVDATNIREALLGADSIDHDITITGRGKKDLSEESAE